MASGYVYSWTGKASNSFTLASNWYNQTAASTATAVPGTSDEALVAAGGTIDGPGAVFELGLTGTGSGLTAGGSLNGSYVFVGGTVTLASGAELSSGNLIDIGDGSSETIAQRIPTLLTVAAGSTLYAYSSQADGLDILIGQQGGDATLAVTGAKAVATSGTGGFWVGDAGTGIVTVSGGGAFYGGGNTGSEPGSIGLALGTGSGSGEAFAAGAGSEIAFGDIVDVGYGGAGGLSVSSGATLIAGDEQTSLIIGDTAASAEGAVNITAASATLLGVIEDGAYGHGDFSASSGAAVLATSNATSGTAADWSVLIGADAGGVGTFSLAGGAVMTTSHAIAVGSAGTGTLLVAGGTLAIQQQGGAGLSALAIGLAAGSSGLMDVIGGKVYDQGFAGMIVGASGTGALNIGANGSAGGTVVAASQSGVALTVGASAGASGTITVSGVNSALYASGSLTDGAGGTGVILVAAGAVLTAGNTGSLTGLAIGGNGGSGLLAISGGIVAVDGQTIVGDASNGVLTVNASGGFFDDASGAAALVLGVAAGTTGTVLISDSATSANVAGGLTIGSSGAGIFTLENGARFTAGTYAGEASPGIVIGAGTGSSGTLAVQSGADFAASTGIAVGSAGGGLLSVTGATLSVTTAAGPQLSALSAGLAAGLSGTIDITGGLIDDADQAGIVLGAAGRGTLAITASGSQGGTLLTGGPASQSGLALGVGSGALGAVSISGSASLLTVDGTTSDGGNGAGSITVSAHAAFRTGAANTATALALGGAGGSGALALGTAASLTATGQTIVGDFGAGSLSVTGGSSFTGVASGFEALVAGYGAGSTGSVLISDLGTTAGLAGGLEDGAFGNAAVTIQNGAVVTASTTSGNGLPAVVVAESAGTSSLTVTGAASKLSATGQVQVGGTLTSGAGSLLISAGGTVSVALAQGQSIEGATIGGASGAPLSSATVTGAGSDWAIAGGLQLGGGGGASLLDIAAGGRVSASGVALDTLGDAALGTIVVTGAGSTLITGALADGSSSATGSIAVSAGGDFNVTGAAALYGATTLSGGTLSASALTIEAGGTVSGNGTLIGGSFVDLGQIAVTSGTLTCIGPVTGTGSLWIGGAGTLAFGSTESAGVGIDFTTGGGTLSIKTIADAGGTITGWSSGDFILLQSQAVTSESYANGTLSLLGSNNATLGVLHFAGALAAGNFTISHSAGGDTLIAFHG